MTRTTLERPNTTSSGSGAGGFGKVLVGLVVVAVVLGAGYAMLAGKIPAQQPQPSPTNSAAQQIWANYEADYSRAAGDMPSAATIGGMREACISALPGTSALSQSNPAYGSTDTRGRATVAWVCLGGSGPTRVPAEPRCTPTGTTDAAYRAGWVRGHLVSYQLGGVGRQTDGGGCQNIVRQTTQANSLMRSGVEAYAKAHAAEGLFYIAFPFYTDESATPNCVYVFVFSKAGGLVTAGQYSNN